MTTNEPRVGQVFLKVNGADLAPETMGLLVDLVVEDDLDQPAMAVLRFQDQEYRLIDGSTFALGAELVIRAADISGRPRPIFDGEVTALESSQEQAQTVFVVRAYDRAHRLHRGRQTRTFLGKSDGDIAAQIAREAGLRTDIESTSGSHAYVIQDNQTDWEFLRARAARIGYRVVLDGRTLRFRRAESGPPEAPEQRWGETLLAFRTRQSAVAQPEQVQVRGWDPAAKRAIVGRASSPTAASRVGDGQSGGQAAARAFGGHGLVSVTDRPVADQAEADRLAQAVLDELSGDYLSVEGECRGEPRLRAGSRVKLSGVGRRFSGDYLLSATRHELTPDGGYRSFFFVSGRRPTSLLAALDGAQPRQQIGGAVVGVVTNNNDPDGLGRVKVKFPTLSDEQESFWARLAAPGAGPERGLYLLPEVDDEVLVAFEHGDINRPYVLGGLWNGRDKPPASAVESNRVRTRILKTRLGHTIELDDSQAGGFIAISSKGGHKITISDSDRKLTIVSKAGNSVEIDDTGRSVKVRSQGKIELVGAGGKLSISESGVELSSQTMLKLQANATLDVKSTGILNVQGSLVKIN